MPRKRILDREKERARSKMNYHKSFAKDPIKFRIRAKRASAERLAFVRAVKEQPCMDCGVQHPPHVMDFDHVRGVKIGPISSRPVQMATLDTLMAEIEKCDIVCANCHRERTFQRFVNGAA